MLIFKKSIILKILALILLWLPAASLASDFDLPHKFKPGDVISSDVMNEIFDYIKNSKKTILVSDLVGKWNCTKCRLANKDPLHTPPYYQFDESGLFIYLEDVTLEIKENEDGNYTWSSHPRNVFEEVYCFGDPNKEWNDPNNYPTRCRDECAGSGMIASRCGDFAASCNSCCFSNVLRVPISITAISGTRIKIRSLNNYFTLLCDQKDISPNSPTDLSLTASGSNVILSWTDNSDNETDFKVLRKDNLRDSWSEIATTNDDVTSYEDTLAEGGTYWYRIKALNSYGESIGSNVIKVTISE